MRTDDEEIPWEMYAPQWAVRKATSAREIGAQLPTRDGRRTGNAVTVEIVEHGVRVLTDAGTYMTLTDNELEELFYKPAWIMRIDDHPLVAALGSMP